MGEAKRRHQRAGSLTSVPVIDPRNGEEMGFARAAGMTLCEYFELASQRWLQRQPLNVPCNGCTSCCYYKFVPLEPWETGDGLDFETVDGERRLKKREDGACIHLGTEGCTVYEQRPFVCRHYDCRMFSTVGLTDSYDGDRRSPPWIFELPTKRDRVLTVALRMGAAPLAFGKDEWTGDDAVRAAMLGVVENYPRAERIVDKLASLPLAEQRALSEEIERRVRCALSDPVSRTLSDRVSDTVTREATNA